MAKFFEKLEVESKTGKNTQFFSDHPNPENRIGNVNKEIEKLGGARAGVRLLRFRCDSCGEADRLRRHFRRRQSLGRAASPRTAQRRPGKKGPADANPRPGWSIFRWVACSFAVRRTGYACTVRAVRSPLLQRAALLPVPRLQYGMMVAVFEPRANAADHPVTLSDAFEQLINQLHQSNPRDGQTTREHIDIRVGGQAGVSIRRLPIVHPRGFLRPTFWNWFKHPGRHLRDYFIGVAPEVRSFQPSIGLAVPTR